MSTNTNDIHKKIMKLLKFSRESLYENIEESFSTAKEAFKLSKEINFEKGNAISLIRLAAVYRIKGEYEKATKYSFDAKEKMEAMNLNKYLVDVLNNLGNIFADNSDYDTALDYYMKSYKILEKLSDSDNTEYFKYVVNNNIGEIYNELQSYNLALEYFQKSINYIKNSSKKKYIVVPYINIGEVYQKMNDYDKALLYLNKAINMLEHERLDFFLTDTYFCIAKVYADKYMFAESYKNYKKALELSEKKGIIYFQLKILLAFYEFLLKFRKSNEAFDILNKAYKISKQNNYKNKLSEINSNYAKYYESKGEYQKALTYYKTYHDEEKAKQKQETEKIVKNLKNQLKISKMENEKKIIYLKNVKLKERAKEIEKLYSDISLISEMGREITAVLDIDKVVSKTYKYFMLIIPLNEFGLMIYDVSGEKSEFSFYARDGKVNGEKISEMEKTFFNLHMTTGNKELIYVDNDYTELYIPLVIEERVIGGLYLKNNTKEKYNETDIAIIKAFVNFVAIALNNAQKSMKLKKVNQKLLSLSLKDALTEIANRRRFEEVFEREWWRAIRYKTSISIIMFDIDKFKQFNDNYGHPEGDECIKKIAKAADNFFKRAIDLVARYGGDEFIVILPDTNLESTIELAEKLRNFVENELKLKHEYSSISNYVTISVGVASTNPKNQMEKTDLLDKVDEALYKAKKAGRNKVKYISL